MKQDTLEGTSKRFDDLTSKIDKLNDNIKQYRDKIDEEEKKPEKDQKKETMEEWREQIKEWREQIKRWNRQADALTAALEEDTRRRMSYLRIEPRLLGLRHSLRFYNVVTFRFQTLQIRCHVRPQLLPVI
jgi:chromosome segregation ATPase